MRGNNEEGEDRTPLSPSELADFESRLAELCASSPELLARIADAESDVERAGVSSEFAAFVLERLVGPPRAESTVASSPRGRVASDEELPRRFGPYVLEELLGAGGQGEVYRAEDSRLGRKVAVKLLARDLTRSKAMLDRFRLEAESAAALDHPHIAPIYEVGECDGRPFLSARLIDGGDLRTSAVRPTDPVAIASLLAKVARAIAHAHERGILHRDLKPSNILIDRRSEPLVSDFGLAKRLESDSSLTASGATVGTPSYMAPEQATSEAGSLTTRTDVWGLGAVLYELLTGRPPFLRDSALDTLRDVVESDPVSPRRLTGSTPVDLETICLQCLRKDPGERYASAAEVALDLERFVRGESISARPLSAFERALRWLGRHPRGAATAAVVLVLSIVGLAVSRGAISREQKRTETALIGSRITLARAQLGRGLRRLEEGDHLALLELLAACETSEGVPDLHDTARAVWAIACERMEGRLETRFDLGVAVASPGGGESTPRGETGTVWPVAAAKSVEFREAESGRRVGRAWHVGDEILVTATSDASHRFAALTAAGVAWVWDTATRELLREPFRVSETPAREFVLSPDGTLLVTAAGLDAEGAAGARVYRVASGELRCPPLSTQSVVRAVAFHPDGSTLAVAADDGVRVWDPFVGERLGNPTVTPGSTRLAWHPGGSFFVSAGRDGQIEKRSPIDGATLDEREVQPSLATALIFDRRGEHLAVGGEDGITRVWHLESWTKVHETARHPIAVRELRFRSDGRYLASASADGVVRITDAATWRECWPVLHQEPRLGTLGFHGSKGALWVADGAARVWSWAPFDSVRRRRFVPTPGPVRELAFHPERPLVATASSREVRMLDTRSAEVLEARELDAPIADLTLRRDRSLDLVLVGGELETRSGADLERSRSRGVLDADAQAVAWSLDGELLATIDAEAVRVRSSRTGEALASRAFARPPSTPLRSEDGIGRARVVWSPDGSWLAAARVSDHRAICCHWPTRRWLWSPSLEGPIRALAFDPREGRLALAGGHRETRLWTPDTPRFLPERIRTEVPVSSLAFDPAGRFLALATGARVELRVRELEYVESPHRLDFAASVRALEFDPRGEVLVVGTDRGLTLWSVPEPPATVERLREETWLAVGARRDEAGNPRSLRAGEWVELRERLSLDVGDPAPEASTPELAVRSTEERETSGAGRSGDLGAEALEVQSSRPARFSIVVPVAEGDVSGPRTLEIPIDFSRAQNTRIQGWGAEIHKVNPDGFGAFPEGRAVELGGVRFDFPRGGNNVWSSWAAGGPNPRRLRVGVGVSGVQRIHLLLNSVWGLPGPDSVATVRCIARSGFTFEKPLLGDEDIRDHSQGPFTNRINGVTTTNVFRTRVGSGRVDKVTIDLPHDPFAEDVLSEIELECNGGAELQRILLIGATVEGVLTFPVEWLVAGPYEWSQFAEPLMSDLLAAGGVTEDSFLPEPGLGLPESSALRGAPIVHRLRTTGDTIEFRSLFERRSNPVERMLAYAWTTIHFEGDQPQDFVLGLSSDDSYALDVNGARVATLPVKRGAGKPGEVLERVPVVLNPGPNRLRLKVLQYVLGWDARVRLERPDGCDVRDGVCSWVDGEFEAVDVPLTPARTSRTFDVNPETAPGAPGFEVRVTLHVTGHDQTVHGEERIPGGWELVYPRGRAAFDEDTRRLSYALARGEGEFVYALRADESASCEVDRSCPNPLVRPHAIYGTYEFDDPTWRFSTSLDVIPYCDR